MTRRTVLVTGATSGLGRALALRLAGEGDRVLVHGRNGERGREVVRRIECETPGEARFFPADFARLDRVRALGASVLDATGRLDVLINNAGVFREPEGRAVTADGHELRFQVNYLAHVLLTLLLLPRLEASAPSRIVSVASRGQNPLDFDDLMLEEGFTESRAYGRSKLALIFFSFELARRLEDVEVTVNALHPAAFMDTPMTREAGVEPRASVEEGVRAVMHLVEDDVGTGQYFDGTVLSVAHPQAYDAEARRRLWRRTREMLELP